MINCQIQKYPNVKSDMYIESNAEHDLITNSFQSFEIDYDYSLI